MHRFFRIIAALWLVGTGLVAAPPKASVTKSEPAKNTLLLNGIAAEVAGKPLTLEEVYLHRTLDKVKSGEPGLLQTERGEALKNTIQKAVLEEMVFGEMKNLNFDGGPKADAVKLLSERKRTAAFRGEWDKALAYFRVTEDRAVSLLWRSMQVDRFIERKVETLTPLLTTDAVERHLISSTPNFSSLPDDKKAELRTRTERLLKKERMAEQLREWVLRLKRKYSVVQYL